MTYSRRPVNYVLFGYKMNYFRFFDTYFGDMHITFTENRNVLFY